MEQRIGPTIPPTPPAGVDPAYIPGLVPPRPPQAGEKAARGAEEVSGAGAADAAPSDAEVTDAEHVLVLGEDAEDADSVPASDADFDADADSEEEEPEDDGKPTFEASDWRGAIIADRAGITFRLDGEVAEFDWDEIKAVEIDTPRFGKRFGVTVYTSERRWFQSDVQAPDRAVLKEWAEQLDTVLDARFEDAEDSPAPREDASEPDAEAEVTPGAAVGSESKAASDAE